jgi:hypothetical protein
LEIVPKVHTDISLRFELDTINNTQHGNCLGLPFVDFKKVESRWPLVWVQVIGVWLCHSLRKIINISCWKNLSLVDPV